MMLWKNLALCSGKSPTGKIILNSFKRCYPKTNPASVDNSLNEDVEFHSNLGDQWWDPHKNPLHALNEIRIPFMRNCLLNAGLVTSSDTSLAAALSGLKVLDVGCGGGIVCEALGRLKCDVTGIDASTTLIEIAKKHALLDKRLDKYVKYENTSISTFSERHPGEFDLVVVSEVLEHVSNKEEFLKYSINCLKDEGSLFITTPNRTKLSKLFLIELAEYMRIVPTGTHDFNKFIKPRELAFLLKSLNCTTRHIEGIVYWPFTRKFDTCWYQVFMYALHAVKNTNIFGVDFEKENNRLRVTG